MSEQYISNSSHIERTPAIKVGIAEAMVVANVCATKHGFWDGPTNKAEKVALMHSELSEMLEGIREPTADKHLPDFTSEEVEAADVCIRLFDYCQKYGLRLPEAIVSKMQYNMTRPYKHGKAF